MTQIVWCIFLVLGSAQDIRRKAISKRFLLLGYALLLCVAMLTEGFLWKERLFGVLPGLLLLLCARLTREQIGYGDGLLIFIGGCVLGLHSILGQLSVAMLLSAVAALWLLVFRRRSRTYRLAFCPFLLLGSLSGFLFSG